MHCCNSTCEPFIDAACNAFEGGSSTPRTLESYGSQNTNRLHFRPQIFRATLSPSSIPWKLSSSRENQSVLRAALKSLGQKTWTVIVLV
jgi:hypothetical protein